MANRSANPVTRVPERGSPRSNMLKKRHPDRMRWRDAILDWLELYADL
ncbi:hypothetical protein [Microbulbifer spongiae]|uniref:Uncharacterized protein n=1 Tax=Microbulbifer spongiae TaxID=2944933 RepID=A0ABY9ECW5_9GAMM|nr:hypothetical protein [Microbulbifer sp. MI-G]WKD50863.1 hypothetical protein M8T91_05405 [Microbulbifer sp. MI-G]